MKNANTLAVDFMADSSEEEEEVMEDVSVYSDHAKEVSFYVDQSFEFEEEVLVDVEYEREEIV